MSLFAGLDCSTQSIKIVIIDAERKQVIYSDQINYDRDLPQYNTENGVIKNQREGVSESDPMMWLDGLNRLFSKLTKSHVPIAKIKAISVSGQQHGLVCLDGEGNLARERSKLWNDFSTQEECDLLTESVGGISKMVAEVGNSQRTGYTAAKIFHLVRHEPENYAKTATLFLVHNFINWYLTGGKNSGVRVMEPGDTSGTALWHPGKQKWSSKVLSAIASDLENKLPDVKPADEFIGKISPELAEKFGFSGDCLVDAGSGDNMYGAVGTGNVVPGIVTVSLGTSGTAYTFLPEPYVDPDGDVGAFCDSTGNYLPLLCVSNLANGYNAILKEYNLDHAGFNEIAKQTPAGNEGRLLIPWFGGERTPDVPLAAPIYFGFRLHDFTVKYLSRAVVEGHILNLYDGFRRLPVKPGEIRLTGGLSQSEVWCQTIADIFEAEAVPVEGEGAALGAALHAAWVYRKTFADAVQLQEIVAPYLKFNEDRRRRPIDKNVEKYRIMKKTFASLSRAVRGLGASDDIFASRNELVKRNL